MAKKNDGGEKFYGTKQVAEILRIPDWRVKNFSEGGAYGLPPSQTVGKGRGSRRLYTLGDLCRLAVANELVNCSFTPEAVGAAIREIPESTLTDLMLPEDEREDEPPEFAPILTCVSGKWRIRKAGDIDSLLDPAIRHPGKESGIFILNIANLLGFLAFSLRLKERRSSSSRASD